VQIPLPPSNTEVFFLRTWADFLDDDQLTVYIPVTAH
jgi:hypothetical protein